MNPAEGNGVTPGNPPKSILQKPRYLYTYCRGEHYDNSCLYKDDLKYIANRSAAPL